MDCARLFRLECGIQHYAWGARPRDGRPPYIAELTGRPAAPGQPFAELWIGAHPGLPARVVDGAGAPTLDALIATHPRGILGPALAGRGLRELPFLLKVLDCEAPLSIQAHPDRNLAARLHRRDPANYPDDQHKPEIAIGLTGMTALCQFRPADETVTELARLPALGSLFGGVLSGRRRGSKAWLRALYTHLFAAPQAEVEAAMAGVAAQLRAQPVLSEADRWFLDIVARHPGDRGALSVYVLNLIHLGPGEAVYLAPDEPHAYLHGTIIECMANSNNVVRAGLTAKFIDRDVLTRMLTYRMQRPQILRGEVEADGRRVYRVPTPEFLVEALCTGPGREIGLESGGLVSLLLVLDGELELRTPQTRETAGRGTTWLWPAALPVLTVTGGAAGSVIIRARPNPPAWTSDC
ncbi:MAG: Mannose-6-phosphate isomerase [Lentisphaerae bacterium ADurb.BinA184]|nr:MAG: Mannose-6-phosphate isomerase [Lentisphaerae bacterium ADurb.BinA184]